MKRSSLMLLGLIFLMISGAQGATYYWTGATDLSWSTAANWSPVRSVGVVTDTLIFSADSTVHDTVVGGTTETVAFIKVTSGTSIWFQTASGKQVLSLNDSLVVEPGANLSVISPTAAADTLVIYLNANARGTVDGTITFNYYGTTTGPRHRLDAADTLAIQFNSGSSLVQNTIGNIFGASAGSNRVVFNSGSQFIQYLGSNPFGLGQPSSKVLFKPGSWFRFRQGGTPSFSGRTYANFELNYQATITGTGASPLTMDSLLITDGHLNLQLRHINLKGAVIVYDTLYFNSATTCSLYLNGTTQQTMDWSAANSFMLGAATNVFVDNPSGLLLNSNFVVNCKLHLTNGNIVTDANSVLLTTDSTIVRGTGYIQGTLWQVVNSGTLVAKNYPVGNDAGYTPVSFNFGNVTAGGGLSVTVVHNTHPDASIPENTMQNYWSVSSTGGFLFDTCSATLNYLSSDFNTGFSEIIDEETMVAGKRDTSVWAFPNIVSRDTANNMITMDGLIGFSDFTLAKNQDALIPDTIAPYIVSTSPADGDSNVALDQAVLVVFSEPIDTSVFSGNNVPAHPMTMSWNATLDTLTLTPDSLYEYLTTYTFTVTGGADLSGILIAGLPVSFSFTTREAGDTIAPYIISTYPADSAVDVPLDVNPQIVFSEPINPSSIDGFSVPDIPCSLAWNSAFDTLTFIKDSLFEYGTTYVIACTTATDTAGNPLVGLPFSFSFTTVANQAPAIAVLQQPASTFDGTGPFDITAVLTDAGKKTKVGVTSNQLWWQASNEYTWHSLAASVTSGDTCTYSIPGPVAAGLVINAYVEAVDDGNDTTYSDMIQFMILSPLAPTGLMATTGQDGTVPLSWTAPAESLYYYSPTTVYAFNMPANSIVSTRYTPGNYPCRIDQIRSSWNTAYGTSDMHFRIYGDDGHGFPDEGNVIFDTTYTPTAGTWADLLNLSANNLVITSGDFHVSWEILTYQYPRPRGTQDGGIQQRSLYKWTDGIWYADLSGDWLNRVAVSYSNYTKGVALKTAVLTNDPRFSRTNKDGLESMADKVAKQSANLPAFDLVKSIGEYQIFRSAVSGGPYTFLNGTTGLSYDDNSVINDSTYYYVVRTTYPWAMHADTFSAWSNEASATPTGVEGRPGTIPNSFYLMPVSPNPVRQGAEFRFGLSQSGKTTLEIYNVLGQKVKILSDGFLSAGNHTIKWNGCDENGRKVSSGAYVYRLVTGNQTCTKRFAVIK